MNLVTNNRINWMVFIVAMFVIAAGVVAGNYLTMKLNESKLLAEGGNNNPL